MFLPLYLLQLTTVLAISFSSSEDKSSLENSEYPSLQLNNIYKKKEIIPSEQDANEDIEKSTENKYKKIQRFKKQYPEKKVYFLSNNLGNENLLYYPYSLLSKFRQTHDFQSLLNSETTHPSIPVQTNQDKTSNIKNNDLFRIYCKIIRETILSCMKILRNNNFKISNNKCININSLEGFSNCQNSSTYEFLNNYLNEENIGENTKSMLIEKRNSIPKRLPFHAWGGKRANQVGTEKIQASRVPFNAWGGKRSSLQAPDEDEITMCCTETNSLNFDYNLFKLYKDKIFN